MVRPSDLSFLYQYILGGIVFFAGLVCIVKSRALDHKSNSGRRWLLISLGVLLFYLLLQGLFQFVLSKL
ncbi:hypothetical protein HQ563_12175 [bacterium]|nr:hypothetical protein [bacterium]